MKIPFCILSPASVGTRIAMLFVLASAFSLQSSAQTNSAWTGGTGNWSNASDWTNGVPNGFYNTLITNGGSTVNLDMNATIASLALQSQNTLNILSGNTLTFQAPGSASAIGNGTINIASGGAIIMGTNSSVLLPQGGNNQGMFLNLTGTASLSGQSGAGPVYFVSIGGSGNISNLQVGVSDITASGGTLTISPNSNGLTVNNLLQVNTGSTLNITGGPFNNYNASTGALSGVGCCLPNSGYFIQGTLQFDNANILQLGTLSNSGVIFELDGPGARVVNQFGQNGLANLNFLGFGSALILADGATLALNGGLSVADHNELHVLSGSTLTTAGALTLSSDSDGVQVNKGILNVGTDVNTFSSDSGALMNVTNGGILNVHGNYTNVESSGFGSVLNASSASTINVGGDLSNTAQGIAGAAVNNISGTSALNIAGNMNNSGNVQVALAGASALNVGKDLNLAAYAIPNTNSVAVPTLSLSVASTATIGGSLNTSGMITIDNTSTLTAKGGFNQTAGSTLNNGVITAGGTGMNIQGGGLSGTGTTNGNVTVSGIMRPGNPTGTYTINGNYTQTSTGTLAETIGMLNGSNATLLSVNGAANLNGTLALSLLSGTQPTVGETFTLMTFASDTGTFSNVTGTNLGNNEVVDLIYNPTDILAEVESTSGGGGTTSAPEPGSALLLLLALIPATLILRRQAVRA